MSLKESTLFGDRDKIAIAIERIKTFEPIALQNNPAGYYVCISGGKDSSVIQELCIMAGVTCEFVHNHTSVDHPETVYFIRREKERLEKMGNIFRIEYPRFADGRQKTMWNGIEKKGLPTRMSRWCCQELKESNGKGRYLITGVRWSESPKRKNRGLFEKRGGNKDKRVILNNDNDGCRRSFEICATKGTFILNPIIDWTDYDVWDFVNLKELPTNPLYRQGYKRVGCIACPLAGKQEIELRKYPKYKAAYFRAVQRHFEYRKERGLKCEGTLVSPENYFEWWLRG